MRHLFKEDNNIEAIYLKCINRTATSDERKEFVEWICRPENETAAHELILSDLDKDIWEEHDDAQTAEQIIQAIFWLDQQKTPEGFKSDHKPVAYPLSTTSTPAAPRQENRILFMKKNWFRYAAALILLVGAATFLYKTTRPVKEIAEYKPADIQPGGNKAVLTLADGTKIILDSSSNGDLAQQGNTQINLNSGLLAYNATGEPVVNSGTESYNTLATPRGGKIRLKLPDGTAVWLNSASSVRYPTAFGKERRITISGEAYLEVAKDKTKPFYVNTRDGEIRVLGTAFNINAYEDEKSVLTTLFEGSINVTKERESVLLKPGQQADVNQGKIAVKTTANPDQVLAWKNGIFNFNKMSLQEVMKQLSRWYDVDVDYPASLGNKQFGGKMGRDLTLIQMLELLDGSDMHFKLEGRTIKVTP